MLSYILTAVSARLFGSGCSNSTLRSFNVAALFMVFAYASDCRALISRTRNRIPTSEVTSIASRIQAWTSGLKTLSPDDVHTGLNIALFPILFFFSGLYYTDVLSTCVVLRAYRLFLEREGGHKDTGEGLVWLYVTGIAALWMRQTNIFWVAIFLAGLEVVRILEYSRTSQSAQEARPHALKDIVSFHVRQCSQGNIHDVPLETAGVHGMFPLPHIVVSTNASRLRPMRNQHRYRSRISSCADSITTMAIHWTAHILRGVRILEWRGRSRYGLAKLR